MADDPEREKTAPQVRRSRLMSLYQATIAAFVILAIAIVVFAALVIRKSKRKSK